MSLFWSCDDGCNTSVKSYTLPDDWLSYPIYSATQKFLGMNHRCPRCQIKRRAEAALKDQDEFSIRKL